MVEEFDDFPAHGRHLQPGDQLLSANGKKVDGIGILICYQSNVVINYLLVRYFVVFSLLTL